ncbi:alpha/beta hydrolase [Dyella sp.]|jgi:dienelactone hydrolase|uniref:alpha/beta hydrolase n=1 Tax=Dyella sp. TaxID=1869338 RepID=UPI002D79B586|nr:alpha/beta fold hydrolase [Dyella sp.]HET6432225.1 alpha/beta fold hydrolase [Dyella sp.]
MKINAALHTSLSLLSVLMLAGGLAAPAQAATAACSARSAAILQNLRAGHYAEATRDFDAAMATALPASRLQAVWTVALPAQMGALRDSDPPQAQVLASGEAVQTSLHFAKATLLMRVACNKEGKVTGLFFTPAPDGAAQASPPAGLSDRSLAVPSPPGPLPATLTMPAGRGPFPAVLLVAGSGPNDRDETIGPNKPLRDLAVGLAEAGIASLRYDKRTLTYASQLTGTALTVDDEVTDDALAALTLLRRQPGIDEHRVFVLGHSLGALMAPRIAQRDGRLAGLVLLAAPQRLDLDLVLRQLGYLASLPDTPKRAIAGQIRQVKTARDALAHADPAHPPAGTFFHAPASWWQSLAHYDAVATAGQLRLPLLVMQGLDDFQVTPEQDFVAWRKAFAGDARVTLRGYPGLGHLFMPAGDPPSPADYARAGHVQPQVIADIAGWIARQAPRPAA